MTFLDFKISSGDETVGEDSKPHMCSLVSIRPLGMGSFWRVVFMRSTMTPALTNVNT